MLLYVPHRRRAKYWGMRDGKDEIQSLFFLFLILKHMGLTFQIHTAILLPVLLHPLLRPAVSWLLPSSSVSPGWVPAERQLQERWRSLHHGLSSPHPTSKGATGEVSSPIPTPHFYETYRNTAFPTFQNPCLPELRKAGTGKEKK